MQGANSKCYKGVIDNKRGPNSFPRCSWERIQELGAMSFHCSELKYGLARPACEAGSFTIFTLHYTFLVAL